MVRSLVGACFAVGEGRRDATWPGQVLAGRAAAARRLGRAGPRADPRGGPLPDRRRAGRPRRGHPAQARGAVVSAADRDRDDPRAARGAAGGARPRAARRRRRARWRITGMGCTGKTTLAAEVAVVVAAPAGRSSRLAYDDFHHPSERRHRQGRTSAEGYLDDSFDPAALRRLVLDPVAAGGPTVTTASYDLAADRPVAPGPGAGRPRLGGAGRGLVPARARAGRLLGPRGDGGRRPGARCSSAGWSATPTWAPASRSASSTCGATSPPSRCTRSGTTRGRSADLVVDLTDPLAPRLLS